MTFETTDSLYRDEIDRFSAYLSVKESASLIEGFYASGQLIKSLNFDEKKINNKNALVGITGSIGRREAHTIHSDYDIAVITRDPSTRDSVIQHLIQKNPKANWDRRELFDRGATTNECDRNFYYPVINPEKILEGDSLFARAWLLTEFTPLARGELYSGIQRKLVEHYSVFSHGSLLYAKPGRLLDDLFRYQKELEESMKKFQSMEEKEQKGLTGHAKALILRKFAHLFNALAVVRMVCRKSYMTASETPNSEDRVFSNLRAPTLIRVGYWFSDEFHFEKPMHRFDSDKPTAASKELLDKYLTFLQEESNNSSGRVIQKLCLDLQLERGLVRRLFKRTCVELIENYNEALKRIWTVPVRDHLARAKLDSATMLTGEAEFENVKLLSQRVLWPLYALANLLTFTFEIAGDWGYFEGETYPHSGRCIATQRLLEETRVMRSKSNA